MGYGNTETAFKMMQEGRLDHTGTLMQTLTDRAVFIALCQLSGDVTKRPPKHNYKPIDMKGDGPDIKPCNNFVPLPPRCFIGNTTDISSAISQVDLQQQLRPSIKRLASAGLITVAKIPHHWCLYAYMVDLDDEYSDMVKAAIEPWHNSEYRVCDRDEINKGWHLHVPNPYRSFYLAGDEYKEYFEEKEREVFERRIASTFEPWREYIK